MRLFLSAEPVAVQGPFGVAYTYSANDASVVGVPRLVLTGALGPPT